MNSPKRLFFVIVLAVCLTQFASEIYAPSIPSMAIDLNTEVNLIQWTMAIYMFGVAVSELVYGPISEGIGRKKTLLWGIGIMLIGTLVSLFSPNIKILLWGRLIQGCGAGACAALWRSIFRDVFKGQDLARYGSYLGTFIVFIVPAAPILGGYLQKGWGWRASFVFMSIYALLSFFSVAKFFKETSQYHHRERLRLSYITKTYLLLLKSPVFMGITLCTLLSYGGFFAWFVSAPVLLIKVLGMTPVTFGWVTFLGGGCSLSLASFVNAKLVNRFGSPNMMRLGWAIMLLSGMAMLLSPLSILGLIIPALFFYFGSTFIWPNAFAIAFAPFGQIAGYAGALYGFMQILGAALLGGAMAYLPDETQIPLAITIICVSIVSFLLREWIGFKSKQY